MEQVRVACAHDCPCMCSLIATVDDGRILRVAGDPEQPFTAGFACSKVNRDAELVHAPDRIKTPQRHNRGRTPGYVPDFRVPMRRYGKTKEIADVIGFLASDGAGYITGQNLRVDGGITRSV